MKFKVGDKVKIIEGPYKVKVGVIKDVYLDETYLVKFKEGDSYWSVESNLKLIKPKLTENRIREIIREELRGTKCAGTIMPIKSKSKLDVGKWYRHGEESLFCYIKETLLGFNGYGFTSNGWHDDNTWSTHWEVVEADPKEVEQRLIEEAKRRGLINGVHINSVNYPGDNNIIGVGLYSYNKSSVTLFCADSNSLFKDGKWAEIISNTVTINDYDMKQDGDIISFGCAKFPTYDFVDLLKAVEEFDLQDSIGTFNRKIKSITLDSDVTITIQELKQIVDAIVD